MPVIPGGWTVILFARSYKFSGLASGIEPYVYPMLPTRVSCHGSPSLWPIRERSFFDNLTKRLCDTFLRWIFPLSKGLTSHYERRHIDKFGNCLINVSKVVSYLLSRFYASFFVIKGRISRHKCRVYVQGKTTDNIADCIGLITRDRWPDGNKFPLEGILCRIG